MTWLVTGGAGYIGAHVVKALQDDGARVVVLDDLSTGDRSRAQGAPLVEGSVLERPLVERVIAEHDVHGVVHIAAKKQAGESVQQPLLYYRENVGGMTALLEACVATGVDRLVFSSSCATYGTPDLDVVTEDAPTAPESPYGESKLVGEWLLRAAAAAHGLNAVSLRYFNVAGAAAPELGDTGVFNLIPLVFQALDKGERPRVFGGDYATPDGTCIRDYVHVADIADAHLAAARALDAGAGSATYNIGRGEGSSVLDVLRVIGEVTGQDTSYDVVGRRPGDPARIIGSTDRVRQDLGWVARHDLRDMVASAWEGWLLQHPR